jgi:hypothetical protein
VDTGEKPSWRGEAIGWGLVGCTRRAVRNKVVKDQGFFHSDLYDFCSHLKKMLFLEVRVFLIFLFWEQCLRYSKRLRRIQRVMGDLLAMLNYTSRGRVGRSGKGQLCGSCGGLGFVQ